MPNGHDKTVSPGRVSEMEGESRKRKYPSDKAYFIAKEILTTERTYKKDLEVITTVCVKFNPCVVICCRFHFTIQYVEWYFRKFLNLSDYLVIILILLGNSYKNLMHQDKVWCHVCKVILRFSYCHCHLMAISIL